MLELCKQQMVQPLATTQVLQEAERNILKLNQEILLCFYQDIAAAHIQIVELARPEAITLYSAIIHPKDAHVLAAALQSNAAILLTLDRKHFMTRSLRQANLKLTIQTPGDFLRQWTA